jgi:hypothetical protein
MPRVQVLKKFAELGSYLSFSLAADVPLTPVRVGVLAHTAAILAAVGAALSLYPSFRQFFSHKLADRLATMKRGLVAVLGIPAGYC